MEIIVFVVQYNHHCICVRYHSSCSKIEGKTLEFKTSVILALEKYVTGLHHLQQTLGKDQHGLREKRPWSIDRQNFDAVTWITSTSTLNVLETMLNANGTKYFRKFAQCVVNT